MGACARQPAVGSDGLSLPCLAAVMPHITNGLGHGAVLSQLPLLYVGIDDQSMPSGIVRQGMFGAGVQAAAAVDGRNHRIRSAAVCAHGSTDLSEGQIKARANAA